MTEYVFVYGILLVGDEEGEAATLDGYRLAFYDGLATIEPADGEHVAGAVLTVGPEELRRFDGIEAIDRGLYRRELVTVDTATDALFAWVYIKNEQRHPAAPSHGMLATIHRGYLRWGHDDGLLAAAVERARREEAWT